MSTTSTAVKNLAEIHPWGASGQTGKIQPKISLFIPFLSNSSTGQTTHHILTLDGSNDVDSLKVVLFLAFGSYCSPVRESNCPKTAIFGRE